MLSIYCSAVETHHHCSLSRMDLSIDSTSSVGICVCVPISLNVCGHSCRSELPLIIDRRSVAHVLVESVAKQELYPARDICERETEMTRERDKK